MWTTASDGDSEILAVYRQVTFIGKYDMMRFTVLQICMSWINNLLFTCSSALRSCCHCTVYPKHMLHFLYNLTMLLIWTTKSILVYIHVNSNELLNFCLLSHFTSSFFIHLFDCVFVNLPIHGTNDETISELKWGCTTES